jgi:hypothetical protein
MNLEDVRYTEGKEKEILGGNKMRGKIGNIENDTNFHTRKMARLSVHYPYPAHA